MHRRFFDRSNFRIFFFIYSSSCLLFSIVFNKHDIFLNFVYTFCLLLQIHFVSPCVYTKCLVNRGNKKINQKMFFQQKIFLMWSKNICKFWDLLFVEKHEGNKWRNRRNLIKNFKFCFSRFARYLLASSIWHFAFLYYLRNIQSRKDLKASGIPCPANDLPAFLWKKLLIT